MTKYIARDAAGRALWFDNSGEVLTCSDKAASRFNSQTEAVLALIEAEQTEWVTGAGPVKIMTDCRVEPVEG